MRLADLFHHQLELAHALFNLPFRSAGSEELASTDNANDAKAEPEPWMGVLEESVVLWLPSHRRWPQLISRRIGDTAMKRRW